MRPGKLYIKIFLSFLLVLVVTEILIFGLFIISPGKHFRNRFEKIVGGQILLTKNLVEEKINASPETRPSKNQALINFISSLGQHYGSKVWLTGPNGKTIIKSFEGEIKVNTKGISKRHVTDYGDFILYKGFKRGWDIYAVFPVKISEGESGRVHIFFEKQKHFYPEKRFGLGLIIIGIILALLILPVSRLVTVRIKRLSASANRIAGGDISHRVTVKGKDEITELGQAFNRMTDKLERMIRSGKELTANVSHELRTPLARIRVAMEILGEKMDRGKSEDIQRLLESMGEDIEELDHLIGRILVLSKMDLQETPLKPEILHPKGLVEEILEKYRPNMSKKNLLFKKELLFDETCYMDKDAFRTAFTNILDNAVKFSPDQGKVTVKLSSEHQALNICVTNNHPPLTDEELGHIFEPFYRSKDSDIQGSGLGLAITQKTIERHGGTVEARNLPEGLMIHITLPMETKS